jgi:hypothetical protein
MFNPECKQILKEVSNELENKYPEFTFEVCYSINYYREQIGIIMIRKSDGFDGYSGAIMSNYKNMYLEEKKNKLKQTCLEIIEEMKG